MSHHHLDQVVLEYGDTTLFESDVALLKPHQWINDKIIAFFNDYLIWSLAWDGFDPECIKSILLLNPCTVMLISFIEDVEELNKSLWALKLEERKILFIPVNDNQDYKKAPGGSHWSLLVWQRCMPHRWLYFDSMVAKNKYFAQKICAKMNSIEALMKLVDGNEISKKKTDLINSSDDPTVKTINSFFEVIDFFQQPNSYDCGMYILSVTEVILKYLKDEHCINDPIEKYLIHKRLLEKVTPNTVSSKRFEIDQLIKKLSKEKSK